VTTQTSRIAIGTENGDCSNLDVGKLLDAVVAQVGYVDESIGVDGCAARAPESVLGAIDVKLPSTRGVEDLDDAATFLGSRCQVATRLVYTHAAVRAALVGWRGSGAARGTDLVQVLAVAREHLHA